MPYYPRADRPELLTVWLSAIMIFLSKTYYGPEILAAHFTINNFRFFSINKYENFRVLLNSKRCLPNPSLYLKD